MFGFVFFWKFRFKIGLHSSCSISPTAGGTCQKCFTKHHDSVDAPQCTPHTLLCSLKAEIQLPISPAEETQLKDPSWCMEGERCRVSFVNGESTRHTSFIRLEINDTSYSERGRITICPNSGAKKREEEGLFVREVGYWNMDIAQSSLL